MDRFPYIPLPERPKLVWPEGRRLAVWVLPNIEHYEYRPERINERNPWPRMPAPDILGYGVRDYGNRVGFWRMLDVLAKHDIRATISLSLSVIDHYPEIWRALRERGDDILCHGIYNTRYLWNLPRGGRTGRHPRLRRHLCAGDRRRNPPRLVRTRRLRNLQHRGHRQGTGHPIHGRLLP